MDTTLSYRQAATNYFINFIFQTAAHSNTQYTPFEIQKLQVIFQGF